MNSKRVAYVVKKSLDNLEKKQSMGVMTENYAHGRFSSLTRHLTC